MKLLHIIDDEKFIKFCEQTFDIDFVKNFYLKSGKISLEYLKDNKIDIIFIHYLRNKEVDFFYENLVVQPKIWMFWGADGFSLPLFYNDFLDRDSKRNINNIKLNNSLKEYIKHKTKIYFNKVWNNNFTIKKKLNVINQMDYIVPIVPEDYYLLKAKYNIIPKIYHFNYVTNLLGQINNKTEGNILLGNSASLSNNHFSVLKALNNINLDNKKVYVPLNYGNQLYKNYLLDFITELSNPNIIPLTDFLPYEKYTEIINSCDIMVMNHYRQQALGNVILGLLNGCTVFMNEHSSLYVFLREKGFIIKNIESLKEMNLLDFKEKQYNYDLAKNVFGKEHQLRLVKKLLNDYR